MHWAALIQCPAPKSHLPALGSLAHSVEWPYMIFVLADGCAHIATGAIFQNTKWLYVYREMEHGPDSTYVCFDMKAGYTAIVLHIGCHVFPRLGK